MTIICTYCHYVNPENSNYCSNCGVKLSTLTFAMPVENSAQSSLEKQSQHNTKAIVSLLLGIAGLGAWYLPVLGALVTISGLILGVMGLKSQKANCAIAGMVMSIIGLMATIVNGLLGVLLSLELS